WLAVGGFGSVGGLLDIASGQPCDTIGGASGVMAPPGTAAGGRGGLSPKGRGGGAAGAAEPRGEGMPPKPGARGAHTPTRRGPSFPRPATRRRAPRPTP